MLTRCKITTRALFDGDGDGRQRHEDRQSKKHCTTTSCD